MYALKIGKVIEWVNDVNSLHLIDDVYEYMYGDNKYYFEKKNQLQLYCILCMAACAIGCYSLLCF